MMRFAATLALLFLAGENKVSWMKLDAARELSNATGKPILVYAGFT